MWHFLAKMSVFPMAHNLTNDARRLDCFVPRNDAKRQQS